MNNHTILGQIMQMIPRFEFQQEVLSTKSERHARGFSSWDQFTALMYGQLAGKDSLRSIEAGLLAQSKALYHLGAAPIHRSTLAYANEKRPNELFYNIYLKTLARCQEIAPKHKFKFKNPLYSLDATTIDLCLNLYDWAKFRKTKGAVKLHVKLNHSGFLPVFSVITEGKTSEQKVAPIIPFDKGDVVVFDRGYNNYKWLRILDKQGVYFVTRLKRNSKFKILQRFDVSNQKAITSDQDIEWTGVNSRKNYPGHLRRIRAVDPETKKSVVLLTNNFDWSPATIAKIYKDRWQIELFFKAIKQLLKVKSFIGTSKNALMSQLWVALTAYLLLCYLKFKSGVQWTLYTLCSVLPTNLFSRKNLMDWLNLSSKQPIEKNEDLQLLLNFA